MEKERLNRLPFTVCVVGNPYNKRATEEVLELLEDTTGPIIFNGLDIVEDPFSADLCVVMDAVPKDFASYAKSKQAILVTAQERSRQSLNTYLKECKQQVGSYWSNVKVVNIDSKDKDRLVQKWWNLNIAVFNVSENSFQS